jgi:type II secretory pathway pseudopilin PulG
VKIRTLLRNQRGVTLLEILTAILIFILASVFIISLLVSSLDKPKQVGVVQDLNSYKDSAQLLLKEIPNTNDTEYIKEELNNNLETNSRFLSEESTSTKLNAYNKPYTLDILQDSTQTAIIISTTGKTNSDLYEIVILKEGKTVESCTNGFSTTDQELSTLDSTLCDKTAPNNGTGNVTPPPQTDNTSTLIVPEGYIGIYNDVDLNNVRKDLKANYIVMAEIDLATSPFNTDTNGWEPLGSYSVHFEGIFDGNNHTISNLKMNRTTDTYAGLFVGAKAALVKDLTLSSVNIGSDWKYGVLFSTSTDSTLDNISVDGVLTTYDESSSVGGLIGVSNKDSIVNSSTDIEISNPSSHGSIGGLIGDSTDTTISDSHSKLSVPTGTWVGGIVGKATRTTLSNTTSDVNLEGYYTGGLIGLSSLGIITSSSSEGSIKNANQGAGLVGRDTSGIIQNSTSSVDIQGLEVGGLLGTSIDSILSNVSSSGTITTNSASSYAGGIIAFASKSTINNSKTLTNAHSTSKLITMGRTGGLLGASTESNIIIDNSSFTGDITSSGSYTGGIAGTMGGQILNSHSTGSQLQTPGGIGSLKNHR